MGLLELQRTHFLQLELGENANANKPIAATGHGLICVLEE
jgi:hypothetical protein